MCVHHSGSLEQAERRRVQQQHYSKRKVVRLTQVTYVLIRSASLIQRILYVNQIMQ